MSRLDDIKKGDSVRGCNLRGIVIRVATDKSWADVMFNWDGETWSKRTEYARLTHVQYTDEP